MAEAPVEHAAARRAAAERRIADLLARMSREEKIGQLQLRQGPHGHVPDDYAHAVRSGQVGAILNEVDPDTINALQWIATRESHLGIPLLVGRDVIHGFRAVQPIPLGQAATWNPALVEAGARIAALEAAARGINWTFAPMLDIGRDPRWGRVAEGYGEDPWLTATMGAAAVRGFQTDDPRARGAIAACAKHFAGYGASESGRDYNTTNIPERELRDVHLPPFEAAVRAGVLTVMTSFSDIDGIPATANRWLLDQVLRQEWDFDGLVVSDWDAVPQLAVHGLTDGDRASARAAIDAGVDLEMASRTYADHLASLIDAGAVDETVLDRMVARVLRVKEALGLFDDPFAAPDLLADAPDDEPRRIALALARESLVLLRNERIADVPLLPLRPDRLQRVAVVGPLADDAWEQLGTWIFDGTEEGSVPVLQALRESLAGRAEVCHARGVPTTRSHETHLIAEATELAESCDVVIAVLGEESMLSGESHCRADLGLPGAQASLLRALKETGRPVVLVVMAGRALALESVSHLADAIVYAWHPGCMGGPAIADLLLGEALPSGRLPVTLPRVTGQVPIYYAHRNTGRPVIASQWEDIAHVPQRTPQVSLGNTSFHLDVHPSPLFPFGFGLTYGAVHYADLTLSASEMRRDETLIVTVEVRNDGERPADEVVQLYLRDPVASAVRPVRELRGFRKVHLAPGERAHVRFTLTVDDLAFHGAGMRRAAEPGRFHVWVSGSADGGLGAGFSLLD